MQELLNDFAAQIESLQDIGRRFYSRGWSVGTSSNYSVVLNRAPLELLVTASGIDKGQLAPNDFVRIDQFGAGVTAGQPRASAETMLHVALAADPQIGCVLHTHSVWATILSDVYFEDGQVTIHGYEMLKGLDTVQTHDSRVAIRIFENTQDIATLAKKVEQLRSAGEPDVDHAFLLRGHGMYTWGTDVDSARRHVEVLEFLFEVLGRRLSISR